MEKEELQSALQKARDISDKRNFKQSFDLVINLEKGRIETITTEPLKPRTKQEAKKILSEKSVPYRYVVSAKDIVVINPAKRQDYREEEGEAPQPQQRKPYLPRRGYGR